MVCSLDFFAFHGSRGIQQEYSSAVRLRRISNFNLFSEPHFFSFLFGCDLKTLSGERNTTYETHLRLHL
jgi:hypothetical protein